MDKAIFQFDAVCYIRKDVQNLSRETCEHLYNVDEDNVTKIDLNDYSIQDAFNDNILDVSNNWCRIFLTEED